MKRMRAAALALAGLLTVGAVTVFAAQGDQDDPLVTLSYLQKVMTPKLEQQVDAAVEANAQELQKQLEIAVTSYENRVDEQLAAAGSATFQSQTLRQGQELTPGAGREVLVVSGSVTALGKLMDTTAGTEVTAGNSLTAGHLYVTFDASSGCKATAAATVMSR